MRIYSGKSNSKRRTKVKKGKIYNFFSPVKWENLFMYTCKYTHTLKCNPAQPTFAISKQVVSYQPQRQQLSL